MKRGFLRRLLRDVEGHGDKKLEMAGYDRLLGDPDYAQLKALTSLDVHQMLKRYRSRLHQHLDQAHTGVQVTVPAWAPDSGPGRACTLAMHEQYDRVLCPWLVIPSALIEHESHE